MSKKNIIIIVLSVVVLCLVGFIVYDRVMDNKETEPNTENPQNNNNNNNTENNNGGSKESLVIKELKNESEKLEYDDNLTIEFEGTDMGGIYEYTAKVYVNGNIVNNTLFGNADNKAIWSSNAAASFQVERINDLYFITSYVAKQQDGYYVLILNTNGEIINSFPDVTISIDKENQTFDITDCVTGAVDEDCEMTTYKILTNSISK